MNTDLKIKICGIVSTKHAHYLKNNGVHYIGLVFCPHSMRKITIEQAKCITDSLKASKTQCVAVFNNQSKGFIDHVIAKTDINIVQLHGTNRLALAQQLDERLTKLVAVSPNSHGTLNNTKSIVDCLNPEKDYLLIDNTKPGSGQRTFILPEALKCLKHPYFLAGGINANNIGSILKTCNPHGIDASSAVEDQPGIKSQLKIFTFLQAIKGAQHDHLFA